MIARLLAGLALIATPVVVAAAPDPALIARVDRIFADWRLDAHVPGLVYGIVQDGRLVHVAGQGVQDVVARRPVTADTRFRIASMSKAFTAMAILTLRDAGRLSLDAPAETYVPELRGWTYPTADARRITVRDLLHHDAGFVEDNPWGDRQQPLSEPAFTALLRGGVPFATAPGTGQEYSNLGYATLGRIVSNISGMPYQSYITRTLTVPLMMTSTGYDVSRSPGSIRAFGYRWQDGGWLREGDMADGAFGAMGGIETSASDYARWVAFLLSAWPPRDDADTGPVRRATVRQIVEGANFASGVMRRAEIGGAPCRQASAYGMGWRVLDDCDLGRVVTHTGGYPGYGSVVALLPDKGIGIFAFANRTYGAPSVPAFKALLAMQAAGALPARTIPVSPGLATAYDAARTVWRTGRIATAPLAGNMLLDRDAAHWSAELKRLRGEVGACPASEPVTATSAMEGTFTWTCDHGRIAGRVQRAPTPAVTIQALEYRAAP